MSKKNNASESNAYVVPNEYTLGAPLIGVTRHAACRGGPWCDAQALQDNIIVVATCMEGY